MDKHCVAMDIALMQAAAGKATALLHALANGNRLLLLCQLSYGEKSVGELESLLNLHQPTLSQQLGVLRSEGLVNARRDGKRMYYSVSDRKLVPLLNTLYGLYCPKR